MKDKIDPYLRPLYDALEDMLPQLKLKEYMENDTIQIAPLAFMRGRTLNDAVIILDEAQNTTKHQMKMFLTRLGVNSRMIITGDATQIDLPRTVQSGLLQSLRILRGESHEQVKAFLGSKYVQSKIGNTYSQAEAFLKEERKVLFSGTPCQIAGLRLFLKKDYGDILILVDTACHGVPSPMIWKEFLIENSKNNGYSINSIYDISFRDKRNGWDKYGMRIVYKKNGRQNEWFCPLTENVFMNGFLNDLYLRPSCYACPAKCGKSHSDMMLADFWGLRNAYPSYYKEGYYSLILVKSLKGKRVLQCTRHISFCEANYKHALAGNPSIERSINKPKSYDKFWFYFHNEGIIAITKILAKIKPSLFKKVYSTILHHFSIILRNIGLRK